MKSAIVLFFVPLFFFNGVLSELVKLPALFEHMSEHRKSDPAITFSGFISMHYFGDDNTSADDERDMKLPFKKITQEPGEILFFASENEITVNKIKQTKSIVLSGYNRHFPIKPVLGLMQPPRLS